MTNQHMFNKRLRHLACQHLPGLVTCNRGRVGSYSRKTGDICERTNRHLQLYIKGGMSVCAHSSIHAVSLLRVCMFFDDCGSFIHNRFSADISE